MMKKGFPTIFLIFLIFLGLFLGTFFLVASKRKLKRGVKISKGEIKLVDSGVQKGFYYWLYENTKYPCGKSGNHEFFVVQKGDQKDKRNLLVDFHGGVPGFYKPDGAFWRKDFEFMLDSDKERDFLAQKAFGGGLTGLVRNNDSWRVLFPSHCSLDICLGKGQSHGDDGFARWGHFAASEALDFVQGEFPTQKVITYGTSGGTAGAFFHGIERGNVIGIIMDSNSMDLSSIVEACKKDNISLLKDNCTACRDMNVADCTEIWAARIGFELGQDEPHLMIARGEVNKPIFMVWSENDPSIGGENVKIQMENLEEAIKKFNPGGKSVARSVCINPDPETGACLAVHSPTRTVKADITYEVYDWINSLI